MKTPPKQNSTSFNNNGIIEKTSNMLDTTFKISGMQ